MKFVLFRHAQKGLAPYADPELTAEGFSQAEAIGGLIKQNLLPKPTHAWVSPRIRTGQTLRPTCDEYSVQIQVTDLLDLRHSDETTIEFRNRIQEFLKMIDASTATNETHFACTHYDWIEEAMTLINADKDLSSFEFSHWPPAQFIVFDTENDIWKFIRKAAPPRMTGAFS